jgi:hypothetical protein
MRLYKPNEHTAMITSACTGKDDVKFLVALAATGVCAQ